MTTNFIIQVHSMPANVWDDITSYDTLELASTAFDDSISISDSGIEWRIVKREFVDKIVKPISKTYSLWTSSTPETASSWRSVQTDVSYREAYETLSKRIKDYYPSTIWFYEVRKNVAA